MKYFNINDKGQQASFKQAVMKGMTPDRGLFMPQSYPRFTPSQINEMETESFNQVAFRVLAKFVSPDISKADLQNIVNATYSFPVTIRKLTDRYVLELFHGPTLAFKDFGVLMLAQFYQYFLAKSEKRMTVVVATSGDTGAAVANAFANKDNINAIIFYPKGKVSKFQETQLTQTAKNVHSLRIDGSFDDCQSIVKKLLIDKRLSEYNLASANSINIGRLIPQISYYVYASLQIGKRPLRFIVPSGNMGNITACLMAKECGFPIDSFVIACNDNDTMAKYSSTGRYEPRKTVQTLSNAMDISNPSNFPRIKELYGFEEFKKDIKVISISDIDTAKTIGEVYRKNNYLLDPHSAVAWSASEKLATTKYTDVIVATASPKKFGQEIFDATGIKVDGYEDCPNNYKQKIIDSKNTYQAVYYKVIHILGTNI